MTSFSLERKKISKDFKIRKYTLMEWTKMKSTYSCGTEESILECQDEYKWLLRQNQLGVPIKMMICLKFYTTNVKASGLWSGKWSYSFVISHHIWMQTHEHIFRKILLRLNGLGKVVTEFFLHLNLRNEIGVGWKLKPTFISSWKNGPTFTSINIKIMKSPYINYEVILFDSIA